MEEVPSTGGAIPPTPPGSEPALPSKHAVNPEGAYTAMAKSPAWQNYFNMFHPPMTNPKDQEKLISGFLQIINNQIGEQLKSALKAIQKMRKIEQGHEDD